MVQQLVDSLERFVHHDQYSINSCRPDDELFSNADQQLLFLFSNLTSHEMHGTMQSLTNDPTTMAVVMSSLLFVTGFLRNDYGELSRALVREICVCVCVFIGVVGDTMHSPCI